MNRTDQFLAHIQSGQPMVMGIVNVTPDSFSDGGQFATTDTAIAHGRRLLEEGAHILDIGGESTRPGADTVSVEDEKARVVPVIEGLRDAAAKAGAYLSVDTRNAATMAAVIEAGADIINDITALEGDPASMDVVARSGLPVILMHMQGEPQQMQDNPQYDDVVTEVREYLDARIEACVAAGIDRSLIILDPGIGFGKTVEHNLSLMKHLDDYAESGLPLLLGVSRKSFIGFLDDNAPATDRLGGSLAAALAGYSRGAAILRVHDVAATRQALMIWRAIEDAA